MRVLLAVTAGVLWSTAALAVIPNPINDSSGVGGNPSSQSLVFCGSDAFCIDVPPSPGNSVCFGVDGEWNPASNVSGMMAYDGYLNIHDATCGFLGQIPLSGTYFDASVPRGFAWDKDATGGMFWVSTWEIAGFNPAALIHMNADGTEAFVYTYPDPRTGLNIQAAGLGMDFATGQLWGLLRNNPAGTNTGLVVWDTNVPNGTAPVLLNPGGMPWNAPYDVGPLAYGAAGVEFYQQDCTLVALRQDSNARGEAALFKFQTAGVAAPTYLARCDLGNVPCTGGGQSTNWPWGLSVSEDPNYPPGYVIYNDRNSAADCNTPTCPTDLHIVALPDVFGQCRTTAVEPTTWGQIKGSYK